MTFFSRFSCNKWVNAVLIKLASYQELGCNYMLYGSYQEIVLK